jgi:hypothetical protein
MLILDILLEKIHTIAYFGTPYTEHPVYRLIVTITVSVCVNISSHVRNEQFTKLSYFSCMILLLTKLRKFVVTQSKTE